MSKTDYRIMFDRNYIGHLDLAGRDVTLTIAKVVGGELTAEGGRKSRKPILHFVSNAKPLIANKTNSKTIAGLYGNIVEAWAGKRITLFTSMTRNPDGGGQVECVRIRPKIPTSQADTHIDAPPEPEERITESAAAQTLLAADRAPETAAQTAQAADFITPDQAADLETLCQDAGTTVAKLKVAAKVERLSAIRAADYDKALKWIDAVKKAREAAGLTLAAVSKLTGMDQATLSRLENGRQPNPTVDTLWRYARAVGRQLVLTHAVAVATAPGNGNCERPRGDKQTSRQGDRKTKDARR